MNIIFNLKYFFYLHFDLTIHKYQVRLALNDYQNLPIIMRLFTIIYILISLLIAPNLAPFGARLKSSPMIGALITKNKKTQIRSINKAKYRASIGAWVPYWDEKNVEKSFKANKRILNEISPYWYFVKTDGKLYATAKFNLALIREAKKEDIKVIPMVSNNFDGAMISKIINNKKLRKIHVDQLVNKILVRDLDGVDLDYEGLLQKDRKMYAQFIKILAAKLHKHGKILSVTLQAKVKTPGYTSATKAQDWAKIGKYADRLRVMAYDYHWKTGSPGPIAPRSWVEEVAKFAKTKIESRKIILALGTYGYYWKGGRAQPITIAEAKKLAKLKHEPIRRDPKSFEQFLKLGPGKPRIWLQDSGSLKSKLKIAKKHNLGGIIFWRLGDEDRATFDVVKKYAGK